MAIDCGEAQHCMEDARRIFKDLESRELEALRRLHWGRGPVLKAIRFWGTVPRSREAQDMMVSEIRRLAKSEGYHGW